MSPTIRSLVIPMSGPDAVKGVYTALLSAPHSDEPYHADYNADGFEVALAPATWMADRWLRRRRRPRRDPGDPARGSCHRT